LDPNSEQDRPRWPSPAYPGLIGNVLPEYLSFSNYPFPPRSSKTQPFPTLTETYEYLRAFAQPYIDKGAIRLNNEVISVDELERGGGWKVVIRDWSSGGKCGVDVEERWDGVVVSTAWYDNPVWPTTEGLNEARARGLAIHAKDYRSPAGFEEKVRTYVHTILPFCHYQQFTTVKTSVW
jgi:cation diffusion facilitator CzcD-associated flavoprotein CzcO